MLMFPIDLPKGSERMSERVTQDGRRDNAQGRLCSDATRQHMLVPFPASALGTWQ